MRRRRGAASRWWWAAALAPAAVVALLPGGASTASLRGVPAVAVAATSAPRPTFTTVAGAPYAAPLATAYSYVDVTVTATSATSPRYPAVEVRMKAQQTGRPARPWVGCAFQSGTRTATSVWRCTYGSTPEQALQLHQEPAHAFVVTD